jgi:hypothetical protein
MGANFAGSSWEAVDSEGGREGKRMASSFGGAVDGLGDLRIGRLGGVLGVEWS